MANEIVHYGKLLTEIKGRIAHAQIRASLSANAEMICMYWDIGKLIAQRQKSEGWGASVIPRLSRDIRNDLPDIKGFSERNIKYMFVFAREYGDRPIVQQPVAQLQHHTIQEVTKGQQPVAQLPIQSPSAIVPQPVAQLQPNAMQEVTPMSPILPQAGAKSQSDILPDLQQLVAKISWGHNILLIQKIKDLPVRLWYMQQTITQGWSRNVLQLMIKSDAHARQGAAVTNFQARLPAPQSDLARDVLKDPYIFDFLTLDTSFRERELEAGLVHHLEKFLIELGAGFAFVAKQYHLDVSNEDFYIDLLFYHLKLRCFVVIDLKVGPFRPDYAGKMNFYCNAVDDLLKHDTDQPTIGLILCQDKKKILAEYALRGMDKPIGVSEYELTRALPENLKSALPTIEQIEKELTESEADHG